MTYAKGLAAALAAVLAAVVPALYGTGPFTFGDWVNVILLACSAIQVFNASNLYGWQYAKLIASVVSAVGVAVSSAISDGAVTRTEWVQIAIAALAAFAVYRIPNASKPGRHAAPDGVTDDNPSPH